MKKTLTLLILILAATLAFAKGEAYPGWKPLKLKNGNTPAGFRFREMVDMKYANFVEIILQGDADAIVKLRRMVDNEPGDQDPLARVIYIKKGTTYRIEHLPLGTYYAEVAFGNILAASKEDKTRVRFMEDSSFERLITPFALTYTQDTLPNGDIATKTSTMLLTLQMDFTKDVTKKKNAFDMQKQDITEEEFYK